MRPDSRRAHLDRGAFLEAYADGRLFPKSFIDLYSRLALGAGDTRRFNADAPDHFNLRNILDMELGLELRLFLTGKRAHRPTLYACADVGATLVGTADAFTHWGFALGFSGCEAPDRVASGGADPRTFQCAAKVSRSRGRITYVRSVASGSAADSGYHPWSSRCACLMARNTSANTMVNLVIRFRRNSALLGVEEHSIASARKARPLFILAAILAAACSSSDAPPTTSVDTPGGAGASAGSSSTSGASSVGGSSSDAAAAGGFSRSGSPADASSAGADGGALAGATAAGAGGDSQASGGTSGKTSGGAGKGGVNAGGSSTGGVSGSIGGSPYNPCPTNGSVCKIMPLGDSITESRQQDTAYPGGYRVELFHLALKDGKKITFVGSSAHGPNGPDKVDGVLFPRAHEGHAGYNIDETGDNWGLYPKYTQAIPTTYRPHIILLMIGTNDMNNNVEVGNAPARLSHLIRVLTDENPNSLLVVAQIVPTRTETTNVKVRAYNAALPDIVKQSAATGRHVRLVDMYTAFVSNPDFANVYMNDNLHPKEAGLALMGRVWYDAVKDVLR